MYGRLMYGASKDGEELGSQASWDVALLKLIVSDSSVLAEDHLLRHSR